MGWEGKSVTGGVGVSREFLDAALNDGGFVAAKGRYAPSADTRAAE